MAMWSVREDFVRAEGIAKLQPILSVHLLHPQQIASANANRIYDYSLEPHQQMPLKAWNDHATLPLVN